MVEEILERHGIGAQTKPVKTNYDIANNAESVRREMEDMGFINVKMWFQPTNFIFSTFDDFFKTMFGQPTTAAKLQTLSTEKLEALIADAKECFQKRI